MTLQTVVMKVGFYVVPVKVPNGAELLGVVRVVRWAGAGQGGET